MPGLAKTRILATLGPSSEREDIIEGMIHAGVNAFRLNFSHGKHEDHEANYHRIRRVADRLEVPIAILQDLQGPKIRTGPLERDEDNKPIVVHLNVGTVVEVSHTFEVSRGREISTSYVNLVNDVNEGDSLLLDDGLLELLCLSKTEDKLSCRVICGGPLRSNKGINLPGVNVSVPALTEKDRKDLEFGLRLGVDWIALSFVRKAEDVRELRRLIRKDNYDVAIVAKIEKPEALEQIHEILEASEGIMVARGDLGVELPSEQLPVIQKDIIAAARKRGRVVITATQMLESMIENPRPTRAETSDVANAILDGTDVVMLSGETAMGHDPVAVVRTMNKIITHTEDSRLYARISSDQPVDHGRDVADATVHAACTAARELRCRAIFAFSNSGRTCFKISFARPRTQIIGATFSDRSYHRMALCWGIQVVKLKAARRISDLYFEGEKHLLQNKRLDPGEFAVMVTGSNINAGGTNSIKIHCVGVLDITDDQRAINRFRQLYQELGIDVPE